MTSFDFSEGGEESDFRNGSSFGFDGDFLSMEEKAWLTAVECGNIGVLHTYCFSVGRLPEDITIRMFPRQFSISCLLKRNKERIKHT